METSTNNLSRSNGSMPLNKEKIESAVSKAQHYGEAIKGNSKEAIEQSVSFAKRYPIHTAIGATVVGFTAGLLFKSLRK